MRDIIKNLKGNKKSIIDNVFVVLMVAGLFIALLIGFDNGGFICFEKLPEKKDYLVNFLWPAIGDYVKGALVIASLGSGFIYSESLLDAKAKPGAKSEIIIKNIALVNICIVDTAFVVLSLVCLKSFGWGTLYFGVMVIVSLVRIILNCKEYSIVDDEGTIDEIWQPGSVRLNIIMAIALIGTFILSGTLSGALTNVEKYYREICTEKVDLCFGHIQGNEDNRALVKVEFVNRYGASKRQYNIEQLEQEYSNFKRGTGSWSNLWQFCQDSIEIELESQDLNWDTYDRYIYEDYTDDLGEYYFPNKHDGENVFVQRQDKLYDIIYYTIVIEDELNMKGLTLRQINDSVDLDTDMPFYIDMKYKTATKEQVIEACDVYAMRREPTDGTEPITEKIEKLDFSIDVGSGQKLGDVRGVEHGGYNISKIEWYKEISKDSYMFYNTSHKVEAGKKYKICVEVDVPLTMNIGNPVEATCQGVDYATVNVESYETQDDIIEVQIEFIANQTNGLTCKGLAIGLDAIAPDELVAECDLGDESRLCDGDYVGWLVYDIETGTAQEYTEETFSVDNMCYIAKVEITPDEDTSFDDVELVYCGNNINIYEFSQEKHQYKAGKYPTAYFEKYTDEGEHRIVAYIPYYMVYGTGVDGDIWMSYSNQNYAYLPKGATARFRDRPRTDYKAYDYQVTDFDGTKVTVSGDLMKEKSFIMPDQPVIITGYFESKY